MKLRATISSINISYLAGFLLIGIIVVGPIVSLGKIWAPEKRLTIAVRGGVTGVPLKIIAKQFSDKYKITTEVIELSYDDLYDREREQLKERPPRTYDEIPPFDVIMLDDPWLPEFLLNPDTKDGKPLRLEKLTPEQYQDYHVDDFFESTQNVARYIDCSHDPCDTSYYALPFVGNSQLFCYHRPNFPNGPPKIWNDVKSESDRIEKDTAGLGYVTRIGPGNSIVTDFLPILWAYDNNSFSPYGGTALSNADRAKNAFNILNDLVGNRDLGDASMDDFDVSTYLAKGKAEMGIVWNAWAMMLASVGMQGLECTSLPDGAQPELGTWLLAIPSNADARTKQLAGQFIEFATRKEQILMAAALGNPPPRKSVLRNLISNQGGESYRDLFPVNSPLLNSDGDIQCRYRRLFRAQFRSLELARPRPRNRCWRRIEGLLGGDLERLLVGELDASRVEAEVHKHITPLFDSPECSLPVQPGLPPSNPATADRFDQLDKDCPLETDK